MPGVALEAQQPAAAPGAAPDADRREGAKQESASERIRRLSDFQLPQLELWKVQEVARTEYRRRHQPKSLSARPAPSGPPEGTTQQQGGGPPSPSSAKPLLSPYYLRLLAKAKGALGGGSSPRGGPQGAAPAGAGELIGPFAGSDPAAQLRDALWDSLRDGGGGSKGPGSPRRGEGDALDIFKEQAQRRRRLSQVAMLTNTCPPAILSARGSQDFPSPRGTQRLGGHHTAERYKASQERSLKPATMPLPVRPAPHSRTLPRVPPLHIPPGEALAGGPTPGGPGSARSRPAMKPLDLTQTLQAGGASPQISARTPRGRRAPPAGSQNDPAAANNHELGKVTQLNLELRATYPLPSAAVLGSPRGAAEGFPAGARTARATLERAALEKATLERTQPLLQATGGLEKEGSLATPWDKGTALRERLRSNSLASTSAASTTPRGDGTARSPQGARKGPWGPEAALRRFPFIAQEYAEGEVLAYSEVYYAGQGAHAYRRGEGSPGPPDPMNNYGHDDDRGEYQASPGDHIAFRYEVIKRVGHGSFGQVFRCWDHRDHRDVAVKVVRNRARFTRQAQVEVRLLQHLNKQDEAGRGRVVRMHASFAFRAHLCIAFELLGCNLYELTRQHKYRGLPLPVIRDFARQLLRCLAFLARQRVIHCDLKPENVLLEGPDTTRLKVIDFGSSCFEDERMYTYIQSRFYRSPEVVLGLPYGPPADVWSLGCILAEMLTGQPLFPGEDEQELMQCMTEVLGLPPAGVLAHATRTHTFFTADGRPVPAAEGRRWRAPGGSSLAQALQSPDAGFVAFVQECLTWDAGSRLTAEAAQRHPWVAATDAGRPRTPLARFATHGAQAALERE